MTRHLWQADVPLLDHHMGSQILGHAVDVETRYQKQTGYTARFAELHGRFEPLDHPGRVELHLLPDAFPTHSVRSVYERYAELAFAGLVEEIECGLWWTGGIRFTIRRIVILPVDTSPPDFREAARFAYAEALGRGGAERVDLSRCRPTPTAES